MSAPEATEDPELQAVAWDLDPLLDGRADDPDAAVGEMLAEVQRRADAFAEALRGQGRRARRARARRRHARARGAPGAARPRRLLRDPQLLRRHRRPGARRAAAEAPGGLDRRSRPALLFFELEWAALDDERAEELLADRRARLRPPPPAHRAPLPPAPALRARGEDPRREGADRPHGVDAAVRGAGVGDHRRARGRRRAGLARGRALAPASRPTATSAATPPSASPQALQPGLRTRAYVLNTLLADKMVEDRLRHYPHWLASRNLANEASDESVEALVEAVRDRYELPRRWYRLKAQLLGVDQLADYDRMAAVTDEQEHVDWASAKETVLSTYGAFSDELGALVQRFFDESWIDAPVRPEQARRRVLRLHGALVAPVRAAQLHLHAPRRAHARARARPRRARRARRAPGHLPHGDPADHGRDRERVRRDARLRPPARAGGARRSRASRCWPRASRARSPPSSARSR